MHRTGSVCAGTFWAGSLVGMTPGVPVLDAAPEEEDTPSFAFGKALGVGSTNLTGGGHLGGGGALVVPT